MSLSSLVQHFLFSMLKSAFDFVMLLFFVFFFQAEDGIRDDLVTGVQTCALPISAPKQQNRADFVGTVLLFWRGRICIVGAARLFVGRILRSGLLPGAGILFVFAQIGRASCRERV